MDYFYGFLMAFAIVGLLSMGYIIGLTTVAEMGLDGACNVYPIPLNCEAVVNLGGGS